MIQKGLAFDCDDLKREVQKLKFVGISSGPAAHPRLESKKTEWLSMALMLGCILVAFLIGRFVL